MQSESSEDANVRLEDMIDIERSVSIQDIPELHSEDLPAIQILKGLTHSFIHSQNQEISNSIDVLIVDDSPYNLFVMEEVLRNIDRNLQVKTAINGQDALEVIMSNLSYYPNRGPSPKFKIIFLDLHMPVMDGFQV